MRVLHVIAPGAMGGAEKVVLQGARALRAEGIDAAVAVLADRRTPDAVAAFLQEAQRLGLTTLTLTSSKRYDSRTLAQLRHVSRAGSYQLLHAHGYKAIAYSWRAQARRDAAPWVATYHGATGQSRAVRCYEWLEKRLLRYSLAVFAVSGASQRELMQAGVPAQKCCVVPNMFQLPEPIGNPASSPPLPGAPRGLFLGRLAPEKGVELLLRAWASLPAAMNMELTVAGAGPVRAPLEQLSRQLNIAHRVHFVGFVPNVGQLLHRHQVLLLPSQREQLPLALLEAAASGLPIVASDVGAVADIVMPGRNGLLVPANQLAAWSAALRQLHLLLPSWRASAQALVPFFRSHYNSAVWAAKTAAHYRALVRLRMAHDLLRYGV